jgi:hypothetical protein
VGAAEGSTVVDLGDVYFRRAMNMCLWREVAPSYGGRQRVIRVQPVAMEHQGRMHSRLRR